MPLKRYLLPKALAALLLGALELFVQFGRRHYEKHLCEVILN